MSTVSLVVDTRGIAKLTLTRAEKRNALSGEMISALSDAAAEISARNDIRAVILGSEGGVFCAGGDLQWMRDQMAADDATRRREAMSLAMMLKSLNELPVPLIGRVHGNAFGGGVGIMSVCDVVVASEGTTFGLTETKLGLIPATIGPYVIARLGEAKARSVFFSSRLFGVDEAARLGLVSRVVEPDKLDTAVEEEVLPYLSCAPGAVADAKALIRNVASPIGPDAIEASVDALVERWATAEADEGTRAFFEKRPASWMR